ncbi:MAG: hypothetical protein NUW01_19455, partial [Gemmatimonadaceae bacterium]|nr:hypothetical protein [Gemmatimonadaceae bacterium]
QRRTFAAGGTASIAAGQRRALAAGPDATGVRAIKKRPTARGLADAVGRPRPVRAEPAAVGHRGSPRRSRLRNAFQDTRRAGL